MSDQELSLYGAGDTIADRLAREVRDLRARFAAQPQVLTADEVRAVVRGLHREIIMHPDHFGGPESKVDAIASRVAEQLAGRAVVARGHVLTAESVRTAIERICADLPNAFVSDVSDEIATRAEIDLAGRAVVALPADVLRGLQLMRRHLDEGGHDWRGGTQVADVEIASDWLDRLLAAPAGNVAEPKPAPPAPTTVDPEASRRLAQATRDHRLANSDRYEVARQLEAAAALQDEVNEVKHILGAGFSGETLRQAAERVELNCAERARERDAARYHAQNIGLQRDAHRDALNRIADRLHVVHEDPKIEAAVRATVEDRNDSRVQCERMRRRFIEVLRVDQLRSLSDDESLQRVAEMVSGDLIQIRARRDEAMRECERLRGVALNIEVQRRDTALKHIAVLNAIDALLATEPAVSEERCGGIEQLVREDCPRCGGPAGQCATPRDIEAESEHAAAVAVAARDLLAAARQLHELRKWLGEIVGGSTQPADHARLALDAQQKLDLQRIREDCRHSLEAAAQQAERFPRVAKFAEARDEYRRHLVLLDDLAAALIGGTQT